MERPEYSLLRPANRLDVQRQRLADQRAGFAYANAKVRVERSSRFPSLLRMVREFVARTPLGVRRDRMTVDSDVERVPEAGVLQQP